MYTFEDYCRRKEEVAATVPIPGYRTVSGNSGIQGLVPVSNTWTECLFDGPFYRAAANGDLPAIGLVFVQSHNGNTVADNPSTLGGGETDKHLIYEGLSRVDADAVMAGAATARGLRIVFSVWHPELVRLRLDRGHPRHPAQVLVTDGGNVAIEEGLMFNVPELRVFLITRSSAAAALRERARAKPWIKVVDAGEPVSFAAAMGDLRSRGIRVVSAVGGRRTATGLLREGLIRDLYLTTSAIDAGEPNTPFYEGPPLTLRKVLEKAGQGPEEGVKFEHLLVG